MNLSMERTLIIFLDPTDGDIKMVKKKTQDEQRRFLEKLVNKFNTQNPTKQFYIAKHMKRPIEEKEKKNNKK